MLEVFIIPFDENCTTWCTDEEDNLFFINYQKGYLRAVLKARGWLTVADVISAFGAPIDKNIKYYLSIKGDASGNTLSLLLKNADLSDSILVDVTTLNKVNWDEYEVDFADYISAGEEWTVAAVVITRSDKITSLTGDVYIECVYADVNTTTDVEQILSDNYKVWQNAENVYLQCPQSAVVNIYTIDGKMLLTVPAVADSADVEMRTINISALPTGSYIMNVVTESGTESVKIIK